MKLEEVCRLFIDGDWIESKDQSHSGIRLIQTGNVGNGQFLEKEGKEKYISEATFERLKCTEIYGGDILISRLPDPIGRACIVPNKNERMITAVDCTICRVDDRLILPRYLCYFLQSSGYYNQLHNSVAGTTRQRISRKNLGKVEIVIPSFEMQNKIVSKLDILTRLISDFSEILLKLDLLVKSRFVEMFGDMVINPNSWDKSLLGKVCDVRDGTHDSPKYFTEGYPLVTSKNITEGKIDFSDCSLVCEEDYNKINQRSKVNMGDILMPMIGTVGNPVIVDIEAKFVIKNVALIKFRENSTVINTFVKALLESDYFDRVVISKVRGGTQKFISLGDIRKLEICLPPLEVQEQFAAFVKQVDKLKAIVQKSLEETQTLFDSLMQEYFG